MRKIIILVLCIYCFVIQCIAQCCLENYNQGVSLYNAGKYESAKTYFKRALECSDAASNANCRSARDYIIKCDSYLGKKDAEIKKAAYDASMKSGKEGYFKGDYGDATRYFTEALFNALSRENTDTANNWISRNNEKIREATQLKSSYTCFTDKIKNGEIAYNKGDISSARQYFEEAGKCNFYPGTETLNAWIQKLHSSETVTDIDGNSYKTVVIGTQAWMAENLKTEKYSNGDTISNYRYHKYIYSQLDYFNTFGLLYDLGPIIDRRGLCPKGWHVPTKDDWESLISFLGGQNVAGQKLKSSEEWENPNVNTKNNASGFSALPGGCWYYMKGDIDLYKTGRFWCSTSLIEAGQPYYYCYLVWFDKEYVGTDHYYIQQYNSVRCIKN
jgi:uncharacterized protein (TIGR02145 family)